MVSLHLINVPAGFIHTDAAHGCVVTEHVYQWFFAVGAPQRDGTTRVAEMDDGVGRVLCHDVEAAPVSLESHHLLTDTDVQPAQMSLGILKYNTNIGCIHDPCCAL